MKVPDRIMRHCVTMFILIGGIGLSWLAFREAANIAEDRTRSALELKTEWRAWQIQNKMEDASVPVEALADFVASQSVPNPDEFHRFALQARGDDVVARLEWAPLVTRAQRAQFESAARQSGLTNYQIGDFDAQGVLHPAPEHAEYLPTRLMQQFDTLAANLGFDLLSEKVRADAVQAARDSGLPVAAPPLPFLSTPRGIPHYVIVWPVYSTRTIPRTAAERHAAFSGVVIGAYFINDILNVAFKDSPEISGTLNLFVDHRQGEPFGVPVASFDPQTHKTELPVTRLAAPPSGSMRLSRDFPLFGQVWTLVEDYPPAVVSGLNGSNQWSLLALGLLVTFGTAAYLMDEQRRRFAIEREVARRTEDLVTANMRLSSTSEQMKTVINASPAYIAVFDAERNVTVWNKAAELTFGFSAAEIIGHPVSDALVPDNTQSAERFRRSEAGELLNSVETRLRRKDGKLIDTIASVASFRDFEGKLQGTVSVGMDVTERNAAKAALEQTGALLAEIVASSNDALISKTLDGQITSWNRGAERVFGYNAAEMIGMPISLLGVPDQESEMVAVLDRIRRGETVENYETTRRRKDGKIIDISLSVSPIYDADGQIMGASKIARDITERKRAEMALRQSEENFRLFVEHAPAAIAMFDREMRYLIASDRWLTDYQIQHRRIVGKSHYEMFPEITDIWKDIHQRGMQGEVTRCEEDQFLREDGSSQWLKWEVRPWYTADGAIGGIVIFSEDISARKRAETERELLGSQLFQAQKMEAIGQLTGGLAHDFNNLLGVIIGNLDFLAEGQESGSDQRAFAEAATHAAVRGAELTKQLLAFARQQPLASRLTELNDLLDGSVRLLRRTLGESITIETRVADGLWPVLIDGSQFESAILNLAVNGRDAMPDGGKLTVEARNITFDADAATINPEASPGDYIVISVSDTGMGMPAEVVAKVFEPFFTTKGDKGTGLGLSMVHGFVKQSGGHSRIYSEPGLGTTIQMYFPRAQVSDAAAAPLVMPTTASSGNEVILVVEDNKGLRDIVLRQLQSFGYRTIPACNAAEAFEILQGDARIDLLFTDVVMPGKMDGRALAKAAWRQRPDLKVLFTSGFTPSAGSIETINDFGANLLGKPYRKDELGRRVRAVMDGTMRD